MMINWQSGTRKVRDQDLHASKLNPRNKWNLTLHCWQKEIFCHVTLLNLAKNLPKIGKKRENFGKNQENREKLGKRGKIGKKRQKSGRFFHFAHPDSEAGYTTGHAGVLKGHWTSITSSLNFFPKSWDLYTIRSVGMDNDCILSSTS